MGSGYGIRPITRAIATGIAVVAAGSAGAAEVWVVNGGSQNITVIDADSEQVVDNIDLSDLNGSPWCVAFATAPGFWGQYAFVGQGSALRVIDVAQRSVSHDVDLGSLLGSETSLRGCAADRPRNFVDGQTTEVRAYLHVAAQVKNLQGVDEPSFIVVDQNEMIQNPQGQSLIADSGTLMFAPNGEIREATDVTLMGLESGQRFQRAWYSVRETSPGFAVHAVQVWTEQQVGQPFVVEPPDTRTVPNVQSLPDSVGIATPYDRELPVQALAGLGRVVNVDSGDYCDLGGTLRGVSVSGMGPGSHTVFAIDDGSPGNLFRVDPQDCSIQGAYALGNDPVDLAVLDPLGWTKVFVANRGSDSITVVRDDDSTATILVGTDPRSVETDSDLTFCFVTNKRLLSSGNDITLQWDTFGCPPGQTYRIGCACFDPGAGCPPGCDPLGPVSGVDEADRLEVSGGFCDGDWKPLDNTASGANSYFHEDGNLGSGHCYNVWPN